MKRLVAALVFAGLAFALSQCSSSSTSSSAKAVREPLVHFATPQVCRSSDASSLGPDCSDPANPDCACASDPNNRCRAGPNGVCVYNGNGVVPPSCHYDTCITANDCASGSTCLCAGERPAYLTNRCGPSSCRVDADCGAGGYCSPTVAQPTGYCGGTGATYAGAYCHTAKDDCVDDSDCTGIYAPTCAYDLEQGKWSCQSFVCAAG